MRFNNDLETVSPPPLPIIVVKHDKPITALLICRDWIGVRTHWWGGHTIACCETDNCEPCNANQEWIKKYYIAAQGERSKQRVLLMLTPCAAEMIVDGRRRVDGFLGCTIRLCRSAARNTAPMQARLVAYQGKIEEFGQARLERCVLRIFRENVRGKD